MYDVSTTFPQKKNDVCTTCHKFAIVYMFYLSLT